MATLCVRSLLTWSLVFLSLSTLFIASVHAATSSPSGIDKLSKRAKTTVFYHAATDSRLEYVTDSGICETTKGVKQYSGYLSVGKDMNMFFWFFEARHNPQNAPTVAWFQGGPACSSMVGLFQEHGPCKILNSSDTPVLNPYSWNEYANMLYIDQPVQTGFSYGNDDVASTSRAAPYVWNLLQAFYAQFPRYESRDFGIFTESYGGHFGPEFAAYILEKNQALADGRLTQGEKINLVALGINNGWIHPPESYKSMIDYAVSNEYRPLITKQQATYLSQRYQSACAPHLEKCETTGKDADCKLSNKACRNSIQGPIQNLMGGWSVYDVRVPSEPADPPTTYKAYLNRTDVMQAIGARQQYQECPDAAGDLFEVTGDDSRTFLPQLSTVVAANVTTLIWAGDADWICNWYSNLNTADKIQYPGQVAFAASGLAPYTMGGREVGQYKREGNLAFLRVFDAGHEVPYYQPEVALQAFIQTVRDKGIKPT